MDEIITAPLVEFLTMENNAQVIKDNFNKTEPEFVILGINDIPGGLLTPSDVYQKQVIGYYCPCNKEHPHDAPKAIKSGKFVFND